MGRCLDSPPIITANPRACTNLFRVRVIRGLQDMAARKRYTIVRMGRVKINTQKD